VEAEEKVGSGICKKAKYQKFGGGMSEAYRGKETLQSVTLPRCRSRINCD